MVSLREVPIFVRFRSQFSIQQIGGLKWHSFPMQPTKVPDSADSSYDVEQESESKADSKPQRRISIPSKETTIFKLLRSSDNLRQEPPVQELECSFRGTPSPPLKEFNNMTALLENNRKWALQMTRQNPNFFSSLSLLQAPKLLWIGCSDSRVPANQILSLKPGEIFVHRNIANIVINSDINCLAVLQYAVQVLKVTNILVVGYLLRLI